MSKDKKRRNESQQRDVKRFKRATTEHEVNLLNSEVFNSGNIEADLDIHAQVTTLFSKLEKVLDAKQFEPIVRKLWQQITSPLLHHKVSVKFNPETRSDQYDKETLSELKWLLSSYKKFIGHFKKRIINGPKKIAKISLRYLFEGIRLECQIRVSQSIPKNAFPINQLEPIVETILFANEEIFPDLLTTLRTEFLEPFRDLRFYILPAAEAKIVLLKRGALPSKLCQQLISGRKIGNLSQRVFLLLQTLQIPSEENDIASTLNFTPDGVSRVKSDDEKFYKLNFVSAWSSYLQLDDDELNLTPSLYKEILTILPTTLLPSMPSPVRLAKFFLLGFQGNDVTVAVQALSGLFYLLVKGRLGEPQLVNQEGQNFYHRLLSLLQPKVFSMPVRVRFLRLLRLSLQSKLLTTEMRAMFVKKIVAVSVLTPPSASLWLLSVALRMLQSGGIAMAPLIHGDISNIFESIDPLEPYEVPEEAKVPFKDRLLPWDGLELVSQSSVADEERSACFKRMTLWEIELAKMHWYPSIQQVANLFDSEMFKPTASRVDPDDFISTDMRQLLLYELKGLLKRSKTPEVIPIAAGHQGVSQTAFNLLRLGCIK